MVKELLEKLRELVISTVILTLTSLSRVLPHTAAPPSGVSQEFCPVITLYFDLNHERALVQSGSSPMHNVLEHIVAERIQHDDAMLVEEDRVQEYNETMSKLMEKIEAYLVRQTTITFRT